MFEDEPRPAWWTAQDQVTATEVEHVAHVARVLLARHCRTCRNWNSSNGAVGLCRNPSFSFHLTRQDFGCLSWRRRVVR